MTFNYIQKLAEEALDEEAKQDQSQPKEKNGADGVDVDRHDLCDAVCENDVEKYK